MIKEAITALKDRKGSSGQAIKKVLLRVAHSLPRRKLILHLSCVRVDLILPDSTDPPRTQYIESVHPEIKFAQHSMRGALKNGVEKGKLLQTKSSYKLSPEHTAASI